MEGTQTASSIWNGGLKRTSLLVLVRLMVAETSSGAFRAGFEYGPDVVRGQPPVEHVLFECGRDFRPANALPAARENADDTAQQPARYRDQPDELLGIKSRQQVGHDGLSLCWRASAFDEEHTGQE